MDFENRSCPRGESRKKPRRLNDLPHSPLVLYLFLPNNHGHFDEGKVRVQGQISRKKGLAIHCNKSCRICSYKS